MKILAVIPARGGSKGIPKKNIRLLAGKPLIAYSIQNALACTGIDDVYVSTDSDEIAEIADNYAAGVMISPAIWLPWIRLSSTLFPGLKRQRDIHMTLSSPCSLHRRF